MGLGCGVVIGQVAPGYYRSVFSNGQDPSFDSAATGLALGLLQGLAFGFATGIAAVAMYLWYRSRIRRQPRSW